MQKWMATSECLHLALIQYRTLKQKLTLMQTHALCMNKVWEGFGSNDMVETFGLCYCRLTTPQKYRIIVHYGHSFLSGCLPFTIRKKLLACLIEVTFIHVSSSVLPKYWDTQLVGFTQGIPISYLFTQKKFAISTHLNSWTSEALRLVYVRTSPRFHRSVQDV